MNPAVELELDVAPSGARSRETPEDDDDDAMGMILSRLICGGYFEHKQLWSHFVVVV